MDKGRARLIQYLYRPLALMKVDRPNDPLHHFHTISLPSTTEAAVIGEASSIPSLAAVDPAAI